MIRYVEDEAVLRSTADANPGVLVISVREEHDRGRWVIDSKWQPTGKGGLFLPEDEEDIPPEGEPVPWLTPVSTEEVVELLEGPKEVVFLLHHLKVIATAAVDYAFARTDYSRLIGIGNLGQETIVAVRMRWPHGFPA